MYWAIILVCNTVLFYDCARENAVEVVEGPAAPHPVGCLMQGQFYAANVPRLRDLPDEQYLRITCEWRER